MKKSFLMIILFFIVIFGFPIITIILPDKVYSENENRVLANLPQADIKSLQDESFMKGLEAYISDHFAFRENWIVAKNNVDTIIGKIEIGGVITQDNQMYEVWKEYDEELVNQNLTYINEFAKNNPNLKTTVMLSPTVLGVDLDILPENSGLINQQEFISECYSKLNNLETIDIFNILKKNREEYIYYRTDHHWTSLGAYLAYREYCESTQLIPYEKNQFNIEEQTNKFRGTLFSKTLDSKVTPDIIDYYILKEGEPEVKVQGVGEEETHDGLYYMEYFYAKDKYSSFLGTNKAIVNIKSQVTSNGKSLLVIKDSYAHSLIPFLSKHYENITMIDLRYLNSRSIENIDLGEYTDCLFMYNVINFSEERSFFMINELKKH